MRLLGQAVRTVEPQVRAEVDSGAALVGHIAHGAHEIDPSQASLPVEPMLDAADRAEHWLTQAGEGLQLLRDQRTELQRATTTEGSRTPPTMALAVGGDEDPAPLLMHRDNVRWTAHALNQAAAAVHQFIPGEGRIDPAKDPSRMLSHQAAGAAIRWGQLDGFRLRGTGEFRHDVVAPGLDTDGYPFPFRIDDAQHAVNTATTLVRSVRTSMAQLDRVGLTVGRSEATAEAAASHAPTLATYARDTADELTDDLGTMTDRTGHDKRMPPDSARLEYDKPRDVLNELASHIEALQTGDRALAQQLRATALNLGYLRGVAKERYEANGVLPDMEFGGPRDLADGPQQAIDLLRAGADEVLRAARQQSDVLASAMTEKLAASAGARATWAAPIQLPSRTRAHSDTQLARATGDARTVENAVEARPAGASSVPVLEAQSTSSETAPRGDVPMSYVEV